MIICRTPFRISFFGGGTDYPIWYEENGGAVLSTTIDKYCYITCRYLPPFFEHRSRIVWSFIECVQNHSEIQHPAVRETLAFMDITEGVEIHYDGDLPARAGLGSSSSFIVGLLHALHALKGMMPAQRQLAIEAIHIEQKRLKENVGSQDQISAAFGGLNRIDFDRKDFYITPIIPPQERFRVLQDHLMLFFTGFSRTASDIAGKQIAATPKKAKELRLMHQMVDEAVQILMGNTDLTEFGKLIHESWCLKRSLTEYISTPLIDDIYRSARRAGAIGGKLLGAGGGGFILFYVRPEHQAKVKEALNHLLYVPIQFENSGSQILLESTQISGVS